MASQYVRTMGSVQSTMVSILITSVSALQATQEPDAKMSWQQRQRWQSLPGLMITLARIWAPFVSTMPPTASAQTTISWMVLPFLSIVPGRVSDVNWSRQPHPGHAMTLSSLVSSGARVEIASDCPIQQYVVSHVAYVVKRQHFLFFFFFFSNFV